ncbi:hypothetical protein Pmani_023624 [Petrolisthes manimaculis]|uniref:Uncharacterized protein n=1 Tax=Petrolisthes manimaculis TaxID=1843537 RepID=A0AAE1PBM2_9EUCA|nr:hypothetical protein Pmani_023624 [Petrolisthes manimaculis]
MRRSCHGLFARCPSRRPQQHRRVSPTSHQLSQSSQQLRHSPSILPQLPITTTTNFDFLPQFSLNSQSSSPPPPTSILSLNSLSTPNHHHHHHHQLRFSPSILSQLPIIITTTTNFDSLPQFSLNSQSSQQLRHSPSILPQLPITTTTTNLDSLPQLSQLSPSQHLRLSPNHHQHHHIDSLPSPPP